MVDLVHRLTEKILAKSQDTSARASQDAPARAGLENLRISHDQRSSESGAVRRNVSPHIHTTAPLDTTRSADIKHRGSIFDGLVSKLKRGDDSDSEVTKEGEVSKNQARKQHKEDEEIAKRRHRDRELMAQQQRRRDEVETAQREDSSEMRARYGTYPVNNYSGQWIKKQHANLFDLSPKDIGQEITFRARIHNMRKLSAKMAFFVLRQQTATIQGVLVESDRVSKHMVYWAEHLPVESIMFVKGVIQKPKAKEGEVKGALLHNIEVLIHELHVVSKLTDHLPFTVNEAEVTQAEADEEGSSRHHLSDRTRIGGRVIDLRTTASQAIFRVQSSVCGLFRGYLDTQNFIEIHSPKLQGGATESGASVFKVDYFGRTAFLAQSPQLAKQMSIAADFGRVYEIGAVFRAENSNTHRHLTEYTGLDLEMAIDEHYHEARNMIDRTLKYIFEGIYKKHPSDISIIKRQFPHDDLVWLEHTPVFRFRDAIQMLNASGWRSDDGKELPLDEDLGTRDEIQLGRVIKERYKTDYYIIDKFPASARPFYTMPDPEDPTYTNSFDIFVRGQEIISGSQRIHDYDMLMQQMKKTNVDPASMEEYMQGFAWGAPPHAGAGVGLERLVMLLLQLGDIRHASMYPRDPKSLPAKPVQRQLRHPEASTLHPPWEDRLVEGAKEYQPVEKLIANYGDASNTSLLEPRFEIWRDEETGAAVGYVPHHGFAISVGEPLCHTSQYQRIIGRYLHFVKTETTLKPLWLLCGAITEDVLSSRFDWRTFSCAAEQRLKLNGPLQAASDHDVARKIRHAEKEGVKVHHTELGHPVPADVRSKCDARIDDWLHGRKNHQHVHLTDVHPWQDMPHRQYHYAVDREGTICALVVLAQLAPEHGWQVKFSLDFPNSPSGAIEAAIVHALKSVQAKGAEACTFGGGATNNFLPGHNLKGAKVKILSKTYHTISTELKLTQKSEFREKLGTEDDPIYVCYPPKGLGPRGIRAILSFFED